MSEHPVYTHAYVMALVESHAELARRVAALESKLRYEVALTARLQDECDGTVIEMSVIKEEQRTRVAELKAELLQQVEITVGFCRQRNDARDLYDDLKAPNEPRPMDEAPRDGTELQLVSRAKYSPNNEAWLEISPPHGWLPASPPVETPKST